MTTSEGWAHPELLVETDWLADHLDDPNVRIVDCDLLPAYQRLHIPNSVWSSSHYWKGDLRNETDVLGVDDPERLAEVIGRLGIDNETQVVAYDGSGGLYAERFWWTMERFGFDKVQVLHGGLDKWVAEGRPLSRANFRPEQKTFVAQAPHGETCCTLAEITSKAEDDNFVLWDTRSDGEWTGANARGTKRGGRIPGAKHLEWLQTLNEPVRTLKSPDELRATLAAMGITPEKTVATY